VSLSTCYLKVGVGDVYTTIGCFSCFRVVALVAEKLKSSEVYFGIRD